MKANNDQSDTAQLARMTVYSPAKANEAIMPAIAQSDEAGTVTLGGRRVPVKAGKTFFVCPANNHDRDKLGVDLTAVSTVADSFRSFESESAGVLAFTDNAVLRVTLRYPSLFGITPDTSIAVLNGVPGCEYDDEFNDITSGLPDYSYDSLVLDVAAARRIESAVADERPNKAQTADERATRADGTVKSFTKFGVNEEDIVDE